MARTRHTAEKIMTKPRQVAVLTAQTGVLTHVAGLTRRWAASRCPGAWIVPPLDTRSA